jgi:lysozyme
MTYREICRQQLKVDEGVRARLYKDSLGIWSIGVGRNLEAKGLSPDEIDYLLDNDMAEAELDARAIFSGFDDLSDNRKAALINLAFNLGRTRLSAFTRTIEAINAGDFQAAAKEMLDSLWARQVGERAKRLARMIEEG